MFNYLTVEEKAIEWGVTPRHVQHLCREGRIDGAMKRGGVWFIPSETPNPSKNTKAIDEPFKFVGTKKKIFDCALKLITQYGFESVSVNDIADLVGIRQSAVYNHFKSKQEILDTIYGYYRYYYTYSRPSRETIEFLLQTEDILRLITKGFIYPFSKEILGPMSDITKIIVRRATTDKKAAELFRALILEEAVNFVNDGLDRAVELGKIDPGNMHAVAVLINCVRLYALLWWMIDPPFEAHQNMLEDEQTLYKLIARVLDEKRPTD